MKKNKNKGFTLIEILVALSIFVVLAALTSSSLFQAFNTQQRLKAQNDVLASLQLTTVLLSKSIYQAIDRPVRRGNMQTQILHAFVGRLDYIEFTQDGAANSITENQGSLQRKAFMCRDNQLIQRTWLTLDSINNQFQDKIILENVSQCQFAFLNRESQVLSEWRNQASGPDQVQELLPKAVQFKLSQPNQGSLVLLFIIPRALYVSI